MSRRNMQIFTRDAKARLAGLFLLIAFPALVAAACGGDDTPAATAATPEPAGVAVLTSKYPDLGTILTDALAASPEGFTALAGMTPTCSQTTVRARRPAPADALSRGRR